jgi:predicted short-subunit dehydrogenase-like oxidoreductase (DUF2520 family)
VTSARVAVVGLGRLGTCLARALQRSGVRVSALASKTAERVAQVTTALGLDVSVRTPIERIATVADLVFVTVPDPELTDVSGRLGLGSGQALVHCSGALDRTPLRAAAAQGVETGVFHPLQSFGPAAPPERFAGIAIGIDADPPLSNALAELAERLGARSFSLRGVDRARYHAAAVFASNYLVALHAVAARIWEEAGLPRDTARTALAALSLGAIENIERHPLAAALTGPIARGDAATVARHLAALESDPLGAELYRVLACELLSLPLALDETARAELERVLEDEP